MAFNADKLNFQASVEFSKLKDWCDAGKFSAGSKDAVPVCVKPAENIGEDKIATGIPAYGKSCEQPGFEHRCFVPREFAENSLILNERSGQTKDETYFVKYLSPAERMAMSALLASPVFQAAKDMFARNIGKDAEYLDNVELERLISNGLPLVALMYGPDLRGPLALVGATIAAIILGAILAGHC